jgi:hypothetical protein
MTSITARLPCVVVSSARAATRRGSSRRSGAPSAKSSVLQQSSKFIGTSRSVRCNLSFDEGDDSTNKTLSSLDAILQGSTDEPEYDGPDTVRERRLPPRCLASSRALAYPTTYHRAPPCRSLC